MSYAEDPYLCDADRQRWVDLLGEVCSRLNWFCHACCLMDNHFYIVVETVDGNLSAGMRQLNGDYTQGHNRSHNRVGLARSALKSPPKQLFVEESPEMVFYSTLNSKLLM